MLRAAAKALCGLCGEATSSFERRWRAYIVVTSEGERSVRVVCPACAERYGEDEDACWS